MMDVQEFKSMDFTAKIGLLDRIAETKSYSELPGLCHLYARPTGDDPVDFMVTNALRALLAASEPETVKGLGSAEIRVRRLCAQVAGEQKFSAARQPLTMMLDQKENQPIAFEILAALSAMAASEAMGVIRRYIGHPDEALAALAIEYAGAVADKHAAGELRAIVERSGLSSQGEEYSLAAWKAIEALGAMGTEETMGFLASQLHHAHPTARRLVFRALARSGAHAIGHIWAEFERGDEDLKIMAANMLGIIGDRRAVDLLAAALDGQDARHINVRYAVYEALGNIRSMKSLVCLLDGLEEPEPLVLMAVTAALNANLNPGVLGKIMEFLLQGGPQARKVLEAIVTTQSVDIFAGLYGQRPLAEAMLKEAAMSYDQRIIEAFRQKLGQIGGAQAEEDARTLGRGEEAAASSRVLVVDDSKAMLYFYSNALSGMGLEITMAENGQEAWERLELGEEFDLIVTDMNMPVMDGIEFTRRARGNLAASRTPIVMCTTESKSSQVGLAQTCGVNEFIKKPFSQEQLKDTVMKFI